MSLIQDDRYRQAEWLLQEGELARAAAMLEHNVDDAPRAAQSLYLLGVTRLLQHRLDEARALIDRAFTVRRWVRDVPSALVDVEWAARLAARAMPDWVWPRYEVERNAFAAVGLTLPTVVRSRLAHPDVVFVQVGAHTDDDPVHRFVLEHDWSGLCVEPLPNAYERLVLRYANNHRVRLANIAVDEDGPAGPPTVDADVVRFGALCASYAVPRIDFLQISTQGDDYCVLRTVDFGRWRPAVVNMEMLCLPLLERLACFTLLRRHGYAYRFDGRDLLAVDRRLFDDDLCVVDRTHGALLPALAVPATASANASSGPLAGWRAKLRQRISARRGSTSAAATDLEVRV
jgi:hypothetical protein